MTTSASSSQLPVKQFQLANVVVSVWKRQNHAAPYFATVECATDGGTFGQQELILSRDLMGRAQRWMRDRVLGTADAEAT